MDLEVGQVIADRYFVNRLVGRGCLGHVYEARDSARGGRVAVRVLEPVLDSYQVGAFNDKEAKATGRMGNEHVNEPVRIEFLLSGERCIVSPFLDGESLQQALQRVGPLPSDVVVALLAQVLDGLAAAHDVGVVHRDLTPRSVLIVPNDSGVDASVKLIDFGISRIQAVRANPTASSQRFEQDDSFRYLSPEQLEGSSELDARCNVYSVGVIAHHALSGRLPDGAACDPQELETSLSQADPALVQVICRAMAASPTDRFQSAREMLGALSALPQGKLKVLVQGQKVGAEPVSKDGATVAAIVVESNDHEVLHGLSDATTEDMVTGQKLAFVPPPPLHAVDAQLAASRAQAESRATASSEDRSIDLSDATAQLASPDAAALPAQLDVPDFEQAHPGAADDAVVDAPYRSRQATAPGIHPDDHATGTAAARGSASVPPAVQSASSQGSTASSQFPSERPSEAPTTSVRRAGSTARATTSPTRAAKGTRAAPLTRLTPNGSPSTAPRARPKVELAVPATEASDSAQRSSERSRLPLVLSVLFLGLAALGIVFFLLPGRNAGSVETKNAAEVEANAKVPPAAPLPASNPEGTAQTPGADGAATISPTSQPGAGTATNTGTTTPSQSRDKSAVTAQPAQSKVSGAKKPTSSLPAKKSPFRSKDPYNYR